MAIRVKELALYTGQAEGDTTGIRRRVRTFEVTGVVPEAIPISSAQPPVVDSVTGVILPRPGEAHPTDPSTRADSVQVNARGDGSSALVTVNYSADGSFKFLKQERPQTTEYRRRLVNFSEVVTKIPLQFFEPEQVGADTVEVWKVKDIPIEETVTLLEARVWVQTYTLANVETIKRQVGHIHTIGSMRIKMRAPTATALDGGTELVYSWVWDDGTPDGYLTYPGTNILGPEQIEPEPAPSTGYVRDPYCQLRIRASADPSVTPHDYVMVKLGKEDPNGWQNLPGNPGALFQ